MKSGQCSWIAISKCKSHVQSSFSWLIMTSHWNANRLRLYKALPQLDSSDTQFKLLFSTWGHLRKSIHPLVRNPFQNNCKEPTTLFLQNWLITSLLLSLWNSSCTVYILFCKLVSQVASWTCTVIKTNSMNVQNKSQFLVKKFDAESNSHKTCQWYSLVCFYLSYWEQQMSRYCVT